MQSTSKWVTWQANYYLFLESMSTPPQNHNERLKPLSKHPTKHTLTGSILKLWIWHESESVCVSQVAAYGGGTGISVPLPLRSLGLPPYLELGLIYKVRLP